MQFTIVIPVYNAQHTLEKCLRSIADQTFHDFEVLIVNDGSTDESGAVAAEFALRDPRFQVITISNAGPGAARNVGLTHASGAYILHMDADDFWPIPDLLARLNSRIEKAPADIYMYQMQKVTEEGRVLKRYAKPRFQREDEVLPLQEVYADLVRDGQTLASACNKCVRRELLDAGGIRFRENIFGEDIDWTLQLFSHGKTLCLLNLDAYAYTQHKGPSRSSHPDAPNDLVSVICDWAQKLHNNAVAGFVAFEYGICMGSFHRLTKEKQQRLRSNASLLEQGLDQKTRLIASFYRLFGFRLTCLAIRTYLLLRRIW